MIAVAAQVIRTQSVYVDIEKSHASIESRKCLKRNRLSLDPPPPHRPSLLRDMYFWSVDFCHTPTSQLADSLF